METAFPGVYALGDVVSIPLKMGKPLPKAGVFAHREASVVVRNIVREIKGKGKPAEFEGDGMFYRDRRWKGRFRQRQFFCRTAASSKGASAVTALACRKGPL
jgi:sulfide:quinone oxidoreductase